MPVIDTPNSLPFSGRELFSNKKASQGEKSPWEAFSLKDRSVLFCALAGFTAGAVTGLFGAGGGMVLVPLLGMLTSLKEDAVFPASVSIILPVCLVCLAFSTVSGTLPWAEAFPYLAGSCIGGIAAGFLGKFIPTIWLHRFLGILILWGGIRYLC